MDEDTESYKSWTEIMVPEEVTKSLVESGFKEPTPIQRLSIPYIIRDGYDVLGAAETGSGKTLAFGIPIIDYIMRHKSLGSSDRLYGLILTPTRELAIQIQKHLTEACTYVTPSISMICLVGGLAVQKQERVLNKVKPDLVIATPGRLWEILTETQQTHLTKDSLSRIKYLVVDEADRMSEKNHFEELSKILDVIKGSDHVTQYNEDVGPDDESMVPVVEEIYGDVDLNTFYDEDSDGDDKDSDGDGSEDEDTDDRNERRQTLVFSATLTFTHETPSRLKFEDISGAGGKKNKQKTQLKSKLENMIEMFGMDGNHLKMVDVTQKERIGRPDVQFLSEFCMTCRKEEKDLYLYYYLIENSDCRVIIFCNSKDCLRRLVSVLKILKLDPISIHAGVDQKRRLESLEKFTQSKKGILVASDVAARGLDITNVDHVIHYQVPRTSETYVHRSGRTARASKKGTSLLLVDPKEESLNYRKLCQNLNSGKHFSLYPVKEDVIWRLKARVDLARDIDVLEHRITKSKVNDDWFKRTAREMDLMIDDRDDLFPEKRMDHLKDQKTKDKSKLQNMKRSLEILLKQSIKRRTPFEVFISDKRSKSDGHDVEPSKGSKSLVMKGPFRKSKGSDVMMGKSLKNKKKFKRRKGKKH